MTTEQQSFPPMPEIGRPESYYAQLIHEAEKNGSVHDREAAKVGLYTTMALNPHLEWEEKLKYFRHALKRHCTPPPYPDEAVEGFYRGLAELVKQYTGTEALRLASEQDDLYAARLAMGQQRADLENEAELVFAKLLGRGDQCPDWFNETDWSQLKLIRDQWI